MDDEQEMFHWFLIDEMINGSIKTTMDATPSFRKWIDIKINDLVDCINLVDVSVFPELSNKDLYNICTKAIFEGKEFFENACESPATLCKFLNA